MTDQLSLRLEPEQPVLPGLPDLRPMLPRPLAEPFDSDEHLFQPWWGGRRALIYVGPAELAGGGVVRVMDEDGADLTRHLHQSPDHQAARRWKNGSSWHFATS